jgi:hypothetical protein
LPPAFRTFPTRSRLDDFHPAFRAYQFDQH